MNRKIWKALGIAVCMLALAAPRAMAKTYEVGMDAPFITFGDAVEAINKPGDTVNEIVLMQDITLGGDTADYTLRRGQTTIKSKDKDHKITISMAGITVTGKGTVLNLGADGYDQKLTIERNTGFAAITVSGGATANMYEHVTLQDLDRQSTVNACVKLEGNSVFNMHGGVIQNCKSQYSGGLYADKSTVTISGGTISGCEGNLGGGLYAKNSSTIEISGGEISRCTAGTGGGLYADRSTITISGGIISGCDVSTGAGGGLYADNSTLTIKGGTISECSAGTGGGLYAINQSTLNISGGTIENNRAAYGGGVALIGSTINPITHWTVDGNKADNTGGGIYLENVLMDVSDGSNHIYNNTADGHGADIFLYNGSSAIRLPNAADMNVPYHNSGINIDGWYKDDNPRYTPSESGEVVGAGVELKGGLSLVASYKASPVRIEIDANGGKGGSVSQTVQKGTNVTLEAPTKEGHLFKGWKDEKGNSYLAGEDGKVNITVTGDMTLTAEWKKLPSAENLPKTGDESPVLLWGAVLAVSTAACFMLRRRK